jgi:hypothetical protein
MVLLVGWVFLSVVVGVIAAQTPGRDGVSWFFLSLLISPLLSLIVLLVLPSPEQRTRRPCPHCAEPVLPAATVCPHCRLPLPIMESTPEMEYGFFGPEGQWGSRPKKSDLQSKIERLN